MVISKIQHVYILYMDQPSTIIINFGEVTRSLRNVEMSSMLIEFESNREVLKQYKFSHYSL